MGNLSDGKITVLLNCKKSTLLECFKLNKESYLKKNLCCYNSCREQVSSVITEHQKIVKKNPDGMKTII